MTTNKLNYLGVVEAIRAIQSKKINPRDLVLASCQQIKTHDKDIKAWVCTDEDYALTQLKNADERLAKKGSLPFYGIPFGVKDVMNTEHFPNQMGSPIWKGFIPGNDARIVSNLKLAGGVVLGKTSTAEFAVHAFNQTVNPHHFEHAPGTSSSGSAAAVAAYMVPMALGTQTAGSIIRPASYCGVYGFKPSFGLIPRTAILKTTDSLDQIGFFVRRLEDIRVVFDIIRVEGLDYPISHALLNDPVRQDKRSDKWRVGVLRSSLWVNEFIEPYVSKEMDSFIARLAKDADIELVDIELDDEFNKAHETHASIYERTLAYYFKDEYAQNKPLMSVVLQEMIERGQRITPEDYLKALDVQDRLAKKLDAVYGNVDIMLTNSTAAVAMKGLEVMDKPDTCLIWTLCGVPVVNVPCFKGPLDLPFGLQVTARKYNDYLLINFLSLLRSKGLISEGTYPDLKHRF